ncbi:hypothetical protein BJ875DRAFT_220465 [Amylocarpus encephaloides]|uniref:Uncharacterized protein n=1 Tax=Amylocarpus encephaloides TaxID=45428 RepID=A0A9P8CA72_9HELO|nr:hypothetical protein BJ875DRAFT_220465 [Amylocarpus encephaloides]
MHDSMMAQIAMDEHHASGGENHGPTDGWVDISHGYSSSQHQSPIYETGGYSFLQPAQQHHGMPIAPSFNDPQRMQRRQQQQQQQQQPQPQPQPLPSHPPPPHQQLLPLIMPSHPTWPSMLTNPAATYSPAPVPIPAVSAPVVKGNANAKPLGHGATTARKTLSDNDRRLMCQYSEEHPSAKQSEIGNLFGVERR